MVQCNFQVVCSVVTGAMLGVPLLFSDGPMNFPKIGCPVKCCMLDASMFNAGGLPPMRGVCGC